MRMAFFLAFLLVALGYAAWRGGGPERAMAAIALTMVGADKMLHAFVPVEFASLDTGHRFWPMCVAVLHILPLLAHTSRFLDVEIHPAAYLTMQVATSWLVPPILILATWRHQRRLARGDSEPSWYISSRRSIPRTANR